MKVTFSTPEKRVIKGNKAMMRILHKYQLEWVGNYGNEEMWLEPKQETPALTVVKTTEK